MRSLPRRPLADTLVELLESLVPVRAAEAGIRVADVALELPLEIKVGPGGELLANPPRWRWTTDFDERPSRIAARFQVVDG